MHKFKTARLTNQYNAPSIWKRSLAYIIDLFLVNFVVTIPFSKNINNLSINFDLLFAPNNNNLFLISLFVIFSLLFYFSVLEYKTGQTLGKMLMKIYTVSLVDKQLTLAQTFLRNLTKPFPIVLLVDVAYMFFKGGNQRLFEVFSRTAVVEKEIVFK